METQTLYRRCGTKYWVYAQNVIETEKSYKTCYGVIQKKRMTNEHQSFHTSKEECEQAILDYVNHELAIAMGKVADFQRVLDMLLKNPSATFIP